MRHNRAAFERWRIVPRMLHGTTTRDLTTTVLGTDLRAPLLLAPVGAGALVKPDSDVHIARGAAAARTPYIFSSQGCSPMEDTARRWVTRRSGTSSTGPPTSRWSTR